MNWAWYIMEVLKCSKKISCCYVILDGLLPVRNNITINITR